MHGSLGYKETGRHSHYHKEVMEKCRCQGMAFLLQKPIARRLHLLLLLEPYSPPVESSFLSMAIFRKHKF